ncbi:tRNA lysidine(34) synthetase TilS [Ramlibacter rhizophilus]|uniref:tRNA lysidine(34) synthetase TilS n=1 Tax=Ramlibacter rhizophilus TaxID=1781167 RepID=UPI001F0ED23E|nr:tRNA lysidine(34) synthetase TilS [Ramlibacter rhizophilus]
MEAALADVPVGVPLGVAYSGGADSTALLLAAARLRPGQVQALHVHHGLQAAADDFERHCAQVCECLGVPIHVERVDARHAPGDSPEDAARRARYEALARVAQAHGLRTVLLGQHADDQVETLLLALSRGAGLPGLAGMAPSFERDGVTFLRPLLRLPGPVLREWLRTQGQGWIEDPSNADTGLTRNRIRHGLMPALEAAFPAFRDTFARSARHAAQAQRLLHALAQDDLSAMQGDPDIAALQRLPRERQANLLRHWLAAGHGVACSSAQLEELLDQVQACRTRGHGIRIKVASGRVEREGPRLAWHPAI